MTVPTRAEIRDRARAVVPDIEVRGPKEWHGHTYRAVYRGEDYLGGIVDSAGGYRAFRRWQEFGVFGSIDAARDAIVQAQP